MRILIVEDEKDFRETLIQFLQQNGYECTVAVNYRRAVEILRSDTFDCILLDVGLPDGSGIDLLHQLKREIRNAGVLIISARDSVDDKVKGLELGADDYITKPFHLAELHARIQSVIRRKSKGKEEKIEFQDLLIKLNEKQVFVKGNPVQLTRKEYEILVFLAGNPTFLVTKEALADAIWGDKADMSGSFDFVYSQMKNLKKKLADAGVPEYIKVVYGMGYKLI